MGQKIRTTGYVTNEREQVKISQQESDYSRNIGSRFNKD